MEENVLLAIMETARLMKISEELIDPDFEHIKFHFKSDSNKQIILNVIINPEKKYCKNINIALSLESNLDTLKELFSFIKMLGERNVILVDQEIKNELFKQNLNSFTTKQQTLDIPNSWIHETESQATISLDFDDFCSNSIKLAKRDRLLRQ